LRRRKKMNKGTRRSIAERLRKVRESLGLTLKEVIPAAKIC